VRVAARRRWKGKEWKKRRVVPQQPQGTTGRTKRRQKEAAEKRKWEGRWKKQEK
jgi:hypothetical protein